VSANPAPAREFFLACKALDAVTDEVLTRLELIDRPHRADDPVAEMDALDALATLMFHREEL
jgi:hypothetical protein